MAPYGAAPHGAPHAAPVHVGVGVGVPTFPGTVICSAWHSGVGGMLLVAPGRALGPFCRVQSGTLLLERAQTLVTTCLRAVWIFAVSPDPLHPPGFHKAPEKVGSLQPSSFPPPSPFPLHVAAAVTSQHLPLIPPHPKSCTHGAGAGSGVVAVPGSGTRDTESPRSIGPAPAPCSRSSRLQNGARPRSVPRMR